MAREVLRRRDAVQEESTVHNLAPACLRTLLLVSFLTGTGLAQSDDLTRALDALDEALVEEENLTDRTRRALRDVIGALRNRRDAAPHSSELESLIELVEGYGSASEFKDRKAALQAAFPHLTFKGTFRFRHESSFGLDDRRNRHRQRLRFRLQADFEIDDEFAVQARITTGEPTDPNSPYVTLGSGLFDKLALNFDRVNLAYTPSWAPGASLTVGKFGHPFATNPVYSELVWDADVQPEGVVLAVAIEGDGVLERLDLHVGLYDVLERGNADDAHLATAQIAAQLDLGDDVDLALSTAYYHWSDPTPEGNVTVLADDAGNAVVDIDGDTVPEDFVSEFGVVDVIAAVTLTAADRPLTFSGQLIWNTRARTGEDLGWATGVSFGRTRRRGDWRVYYQFQIVERDAVFSPVSQDDFLFQTNHRSHVLGFQYMVTDSVQMHLWALASSRDETGTTPTSDGDEFQFRIRLDVTVTF